VTASTRTSLFLATENNTNDDACSSGTIKMPAQGRTFAGAPTQGEREGEVA
jgi:hypothetical protein